jgi:hypothetical protein
MMNQVMAIFGQPKAVMLALDLDDGSVSRGFWRHIALGTTSSFMSSCTATPGFDIIARAGRSMPSIWVMSEADTGMVTIIMAESAALWSALWVVDAKGGDSARFAM